MIYCIVKLWVFQVMSLGCLSKYIGMSIEYFRKISIKSYLFKTLVLQSIKFSSLKKKVFYKGARFCGK